MLVRRSTLGVRCIDRASVCKQTAKAIIAKMKRLLNLSRSCIAPTRRLVLAMSIYFHIYLIRYALLYIPLPFPA